MSDDKYFSDCPNAWDVPHTAEFIERLRKALNGEKENV